MSRYLFRTPSGTALALGLFLTPILPMSTALAVDGDVYGNGVKNNSAINDYTAIDNSLGVSNNTLDINGNTVTGNAYGTYAQKKDTVKNNKIIVSNGSTVNNNVYGGYTNFDEATSNTVAVNGGTVGGNIYGGYSGFGTATKNTVEINASSVGGGVYGGFSGSGSDAFTGNTLHIGSNTTISSAQNFEIVHFNTAGKVTIGDLDTTPAGVGADKLVTLKAENINIDLAGQITGSGGIDKNGTGTLTLTGMNSYDGVTKVTEGTLAGNIADNTDLEVLVDAAYDGTGAARRVNILSGAGKLINGNGLTVQSGTFKGVISGAGSLVKDGEGELTLSAANEYTGLTEVQGGTLTLSGAGKISEALVLHSGTTLNALYADVDYLERLDVRGPATWRGRLNMMGETMNFYLPATLGEDPMLTVDGTANIGDSRINVEISGDGSLLHVGDHATLISAETLDGKPADNTTKVEGIQGVSLKYEFDVAVADNQLGITVSRIGLHEQTKALSEGLIGGLSLVTMGADFIAGQGMGKAVSAAQGSGFGVYGGVSGGSMRINSGSNVDLKSGSLLTGFAWSGELTPGRLTSGVFVEYGNGSYDTYNSFRNAASVKGEGDVYHVGGGLLGRMDFKNNAYLEGSLRAGSLHNKYKNANLVGNRVRGAKYDSSTPYYGLHLGVGTILNVGTKNNLDLYGKYFWTQVQGDSVKLSSGEKVKFKDMDSQRLRGGLRLSHATSETISHYIGAAYEYEFSGKAKGSVFGYDIDAPSIQGSSGIGEAGLTLKPSRSVPFSIDLGVQGYVGKREGVTGSIQARYEF